MAKRRVILVGVGGRSALYRDATAFDYPETTELVGLCDNNAGRLALAQAQLKARGKDVPGFPPEQLEAMIRQLKADLVVVTSRDSTHDEFIVRGLQTGCDVITEKPMTIDAAKCQRIVDTVRQTGRSLRVTFNYRYAPARSQVKELLQQGVIGRVLSVEFQWLLDTSHGADYFRRWHRNKVNSGGLLVHKATHHFDLVNWWINSVPAKVSATGARVFYTPEQAVRYGFTRRGERCLDCPESSRCPFFLDIKGNAQLRELYLDQESHDGYQRDRCVFSDQIDIEDTMNVVVEYRSGVRMSYALTAFSPWEGYRIAFNGTKGRLEHACQESSYISGDGTVPGELVTSGTVIRVLPHFTSGYFVPVREGQGGHGGGDTRLLDDLFSGKPAPDPIGLRADWCGGAYSILTGIAANISMKEHRVVEIEQLVSDLQLPDYPATPAWDEPIRLPAFITAYEVSALQPGGGDIAQIVLPAAGVKFEPMPASGTFMNVHSIADGNAGVIYFKATYDSPRTGPATLCFGADGPAKAWVNGKEAGVWPTLTNPSAADKCRAKVDLRKGPNELVVAMDTNAGNAWGIFARFE
ncbi:Gfo/Idh/MocA family oxidoreductase [bacterium]|nr:Gfo/Idh/MocA family oxidoreductase [bacterium]